MSYAGKSKELHLILAQPLSVEEEQVITSLMVVKVVSPILVRSLSEAAFQHILEDAQLVHSNLPQTTEGLVKEWLGEFPEISI